MWLDGWDDHFCVGIGVCIDVVLVIVVDVVTGIVGVGVGAGAGAMGTVIFCGGVVVKVMGTFLLMISFTIVFSGMMVLVFVMKKFAGRNMIVDVLLS